MNYNESTAINFSSLKHMDTSPLEYKSKLDKPKKQTAAMLQGSAFHCATLEPSLYPKRYMTKELYNDLESKHSVGPVILKDEVYQSVCDMVDSLTLAGFDLGNYCMVEDPIYWTDEVTGLECKGRPDAVRCADGFDELKSISSTYLNPRKFCSHYYDMHWHAQMAFYRDGLKENGYDVSRCTCWAVVQTEPYDVIEWDIPHNVIEDGRREYRKWLIDLKQCIKTNTWLGRSKGERYTLIRPAYLNKALSITSKYEEGWVDD